MASISYIAASKPRSHTDILRFPIPKTTNVLKNQDPVANLSATLMQCPSRPKAHLSAVPSRRGDIIEISVLPVKVRSYIPRLLAALQLPVERPDPPLHQIIASLRV